MLFRSINDFEVFFGFWFAVYPYALRHWLRREVCMSVWGSIWGRLSTLEGSLRRLEGRINGVCGNGSIGGSLRAQQLNQLPEGHNLLLTSQPGIRTVGNVNELK